MLGRWRASLPVPFCCALMPWSSLSPEDECLAPTQWLPSICFRAWAFRFSGFDKIYAMIEDCDCQCGVAYFISRGRSSRFVAPCSDRYLADFPVQGLSREAHQRF